MPTSDFQYDLNRVSNDVATLNVSGDLTIENSILLRDKFIYTGLAFSKLTIVVNQVRNIDLSFIQLLIGYIQHRTKAEKSTFVEFDLDAPMLELLKITGSIETIYTLQS